MPTLYEQWAAQKGMPVQSGSGGAYTTGTPVASKKVNTKKGSGNKSWLSSILSETAGAGGALGGAAAGAALGSVVPGVGNIVGGIAGGILGGFGGGTAGRLAENKWRDNEFRLGDALKEGAVSGAFGGIGPAWQGARGLGALGKASGGGISAGVDALSGLGDDAAKVAAGKAISRGGAKAARGVVSGVDELGRVAGAGRSISSNAIGIGQGAKAPGMTQGLGARESDELLKTLTKKFGISADAPEKMQRALEPLLDKTGKEIAEQYAKSGVKYSTKQLDTVYDDVLTTLMNDPSVNLNKAGWDQIGKQLELLKNAKNPSSLWEYQKNLGKSINFGKSADAKLVDREAVARVIREKVGTLLDDTVKDVRGARTLYGQGKQADDLLRVASKQADKSGLITRIATSQPVRSLEAKTGAAIQGTGNVLSNPIVSNSGRLARGTLARGLANSAIGQPTEDPNAVDQGYGEDPNVMQTNPDGSYQQAGAGVFDDTFNLNDPTAQQAPQQSTYSLQQAMADIQRDPKNASDYMKYYDFISGAEADQKEAAGGGGPNTTKTTAQQYGLAESGYGALQQLAGLIQENPGIVNKTATPGRKLPIIGGVISNQAGTGEYDAIGYNIADSILRLRTGAQANESEVKNLQTQIMPRAGDSQQTVQRKLQQIQQIFQSTLSRANGTSSLGSALQQQPY